MPRRGSILDGAVATRDEMRYADWQQRLARATTESGEGPTITLDAYMKRRTRTSK